MRRTTSRTTESVDEIVDYTYGGDGTTTSTTPGPSSAGRRTCCPGPPMLLAVVTFLFGAYINSLAQAILQREQNPVTQTLPDLGFQTLHFVPQDSYYADLALFLIDGFAFVRFLADPALRWMFLRRRLFVQGVVFLLRAVAISVTHLPNPYPSCKAPPLTYGPGLTAILIMLGMVKTCNDVMFSGHAASMTLSALFLIWHGHLQRLRDKISSTWLRILSALFRTIVIVGWILGLLTVIGTRFHYTLDVFIGSLVAAMSFLLLYSLIALVRLFDDDFEEYPAEMCGPIITFIAWFERVELKSVDLINQEF